MGLILNIGGETELVGSEKTIRFIRPFVMSIGYPSSDLYNYLAM